LNSIALLKKSLCHQIEAAGRSTTNSKAFPIITGKRHSVGASWDAHIQMNSSSSVFSFAVSKPRFEKVSRDSGSPTTLT